MFVVIFEVQPKATRWNDYLELAKYLKPKLEAIDGFIDNERFESRHTKGRVLSLSTWRDEKSVVRWRTQMRHHEIQEKGRSEILLECFRAYRLGRFRCCIDARRRYFANFMARSRCRGNL